MLALLLAAATAASAPTWARDVAPILYRHCVSCHHAGQVAPFSLITFEDAKQRARLIASVTRARTMPPWMPQPGFNRFAHERRLTSLQISTLSRWTAAGAPQGNPATAPAPPRFDNQWQLGTPDLVVSLPQPFDIPTTGEDAYRCFVVPMRIAADRYIRAVEFRPSNHRVVHHALLFTDASPAARESSYPCFGTIGLLPTTGIGGWSPGNGPITTLPDAALPLAAHSKLVVQVHYHPNGKPEQDQWSAGFYFTDRKPTRQVVDAGLSSKRIDIPPGDAHYVVRDHFTLPIDVDAVGIIPHAHYICREMRGWAILPDGHKQWLLNIAHWDFDWQDQYRYAKPIRLPADTRLEMEFVYDNSAANPHNPHKPPQRVEWGPGLDDEMAGLHVQVIPVDMGELPLLGQALWGKIMRSVGGKFYRMPQ